MMPLRRTLCGLILSLLIGTGALAEMRMWTDSTGRFKVEAEFIELVDGKVSLKRADNGKIVKFPLVRLSKSDQQFLRTFLTERRKQKLAKKDDAAEASTDAADATDEPETPATETVKPKPAARQSADKPAASDNASAGNESPAARPAPRLALPTRRAPNNVINSVRGAVYRTQTLNNLRQIALALQNYESTHGRFPAAAISTPDGKPGLSWRVAILPMIEEDALYRQFHLNEPWDSPHNRELARQMPDLYRSPGSDTDDGYTNYLAVVGPDSLISADRKGTALRQVRDGTSLTIAIVEADDTYATLWTQPDDYVVDTNEPGYGLGGIWSGLFFAVMGDGSAKSIPLSISGETLNALFTCNGGEPVSLP